MAEEADVSDVVIRTLLARRESLRHGEGARTLQILWQRDVRGDARVAYLGGTAGTAAHVGRRG